MNNSLMLILSLATGMLFGLFYFGGLWFTLKHMPYSNQPALLALGSFLGRSAVCLIGFYLILGNGLGALAISLTGFVLSKFALIRHLKPHAHLEVAHG